MNDSWWAMKKMMEEREREILAGVRATRPWLRAPSSKVSGEKGGLKRAMGRALLSWGSALLSDR